MLLVPAAASFAGFELPANYCSVAKNGFGAGDPDCGGTTHDQCVAIATELVAVWAMSGGRWGVPDGDGTDGCVGDGGDVFRINPPVGQVATVTVEVVDDRGVIINLRDLGPGHAITARMRVAKMSNRDKRETIPTQAEVETDADGEPVIKESNALPVHRARRQWRPAAIVIEYRHVTQDGPQTVSGAQHQPSANPGTSGHNGTAPNPTNNPNTSTSRNRYKPSVHDRNTAASRGCKSQRLGASTGHSRPRPPRCHTAQACHRNCSP